MDKKAVEVMRDLLWNHKSIDGSKDVEQAYQKSIQALEAIQKAGKMLPKAKVIKKTEYPTRVEMTDIGFSYGYNDYRQKAIPIVAKLQEEIIEVNKARALEQGAWEETKKYQDKCVQLQKENEELKTVVANYKLQAKLDSGERKYLKSIEKKLQSRITELLEACKRLLTNCPSPYDIESAEKAIKKAEDVKNV